MKARRAMKFISVAEAAKKAKEEAKAAKLAAEAEKSAAESKQLQDSDSEKTGETQK